MDYADYPDGKVSIEVGELEDRSYTFDIVNYDDVGNKSLAAEITVSPYGDGWMVSRSERTVTSARMEGRDAKIVMSKATDEMIATRFRYKNLQDEWVESETVLKPGENEVTFKDAMKGKRFEYSSSFCPKAGKDTVWRTWTKSVDGISYQIDGSRWNVTATNGQYFGINTPDKIIDGRYDRPAYSWHSSKSDNNKQAFPKSFLLTLRLPPEKSSLSRDLPSARITRRHHCVISRITQSMSVHPTTILMMLIIRRISVSRSSAGHSPHLRTNIQ